MGNSQLLLHFLEGVFSLLEESIDDALAEIAVFLVIIHLKDLFECALIEDLLVIRQLGRTLLGQSRQSMKHNLKNKPAALTDSVFLVSAGAMMCVLCENIER